MTIAAIICEYNPFHNGHLFQIQRIRKELDVDFIIAIMSGDFVQRGTPAFFDKFSRAKTALECGVDLILELPVRYACSSAEYFASGAISILNALNCIDYLVFGTESGNLASLEQCACLFMEEPADFKLCLKEYLKQGLPYPAARQKAASSILKDNIDILLQQPNNILAIEYLKALKKYHSNIRPYTIKRTDSSYHNPSITGAISSATGIRNHMLESGFDTFVQSAVPAPTAAVLRNFHKQSFPITLDDLSDMIFYRLLSETAPEEYLDYHPELMDRISHFLKKTASIEELIRLTKTRNFTYGRISRYLLHLLLEIRKDSDGQNPSYAKVLGFRKASSALFKELKMHSHIPIIQKTASYRNHLEGDARVSFALDLRAASIYNHAVLKKYHYVLEEDEKHPLLIV